jgi:N6-L-threonylcarbamoyladenine synthase
MNAVEETRVKQVGGGGGVLANRRLRDRLADECASRGIALHLPSPALCTDNGAMIAAAAVFRLGRGEVTAPNAEIDTGMAL